MTLYTEEEVKRAIYLSHCSTEEEVLAGLTPIELPTDEEIEKAFSNASERLSEYKEGLVDGAKWIRDKIQGGDK